MAVRRPKKLSRPTGSSSASRLGPGMKKIDLRFSPEGGWCPAGSRNAAALPPRWVISWEVGLGATVNSGLKMARLHCVGVDMDGGPGDTKEHFIVAPREGILTELLFPTGAQVSGGQGKGPLDHDVDQYTASAKGASGKTVAAAAGGPSASLRTAAEVGQKAGGGCSEGVLVGRISFCGHQELHGNLCTSCGRVVFPAAESGRQGDGDGDGGASGRVAGKEEKESSGATHQVLMKGGKVMSVTAEGRRMMHLNKSGRLLNSKKLYLILDLDNTLLHCSDHPDAGRIVVPGVDGIHALRLPDQQRDYYIKLRPGLRRFLAQAATMFEMTIYTAGTSQYADAVASVLDPDRSLFQGRHFSTCFTPDLGRNTKSLDRIFPNGLDMALIVDDRDDVWRGEQANNLLLVRPYKFFAFAGQRSVPEGPTHDTGSQPQSQSSPRAFPSPVPAPAPAPAPAPVREPPEISRERSPPAARNGARSGGADAGDHEEREEPEDEDHLKDKDTAASRRSSNDDQVQKAARVALERSGVGGAEEEEDIGRNSAKVKVKVKAGAHGDGSGQGPTSASVGGQKPRGDSFDSEVQVTNVVGERQRQRQQQQQQQQQVLASPGSGQASDDSIGNGKACFSRDLVDSLGQGPAGLKEKNRFDDFDAGKESLGAAEAAQEGCVGDGARRQVVGMDKASVMVMVAHDTPSGDGDGDDGGDAYDSSEAADASPTPGTCKTLGAGADHPAGLAGKSGDPDSNAKPSEIIAKGSADCRGGGPDRGSGSSSSSASDSNGKEKAQAQPPARRREMSAPPMSPPKVVLARPENDPQLDCTFKTLEAVHGAFYAPENSNHGQPRAAAAFLAKVRLRVLSGVRMVFSGVIPVSGAPDPRTHRLWMMAESHGATVERDIGPHTTHVVAVRLGTAKTKAGLRMPGVFVVHLDWLMNSVWHCRRERETMFLLAGHICGGDPPPLPAPLPLPESTPSNGSTSGTGRRGSSLDLTGRSSERGASSSSGSGSESGNGAAGGISSSRRGNSWRKRPREAGEEEDDDDDDEHSGGGGGGGGGEASSTGRSSGTWGRGSDTPEGRTSAGDMSSSRARSVSSSGGSVSRSSSGSSGSADDASSAGSDLDGLVEELENSI